MEDMTREELEAYVLSDEEKRFKVVDDRSAEWCIQKIKAAQAEKEHWKAFYMGQLKRAEQSCDFRIEYMENLLRPYFDQVPHKATKTQESYQLPSGKLAIKKQAPQFEHDDEQILDWLHENSQRPETYIDFKETLKWGDLKKVLVVSGNSMATSDGEIIPGITVTERPDKFVVEVK